MTSTLFDIVLGLALVVWLSSRQLRWRTADPARMWRLPIILGVLGVLSIAQHGTHIKPVDAVILVVSGVFALVSGTMMGRIARFRRSPDDPSQVQSRTGWAGVGIWLALIAVRVVLDVIGHRMGAELAVSTGGILLTVALNRFANGLVLTARQGRGALTAAGR